MRLLKFFPVALLCGACSTTPAITVVATPTTIAGDGQTVITVTATPTEGGIPVDAVVHFTMLVQGGVPDQPTYAAFDGATGAPTKVDATASQGVAATVLVSLGADLGRVRQQVIQLMSGNQGKESVGASQGPSQAVRQGASQAKGPDTGQEDTRS